MKEKFREDIKTEILKCLNNMGIAVKTIILFGSRARGHFDPESDWDVLVVIDKDLIHSEKKEMWSKISRNVHKQFPYFSFDIIIKSANIFEKEKTITNTISNEAYREGVEM